MGNNNCCGCDENQTQHEHLLLKQQINTHKLLKNTESQPMKCFHKEYKQKRSDETDIDNDRIETITEQKQYNEYIENPRQDSNNIVVILLHENNMRSLKLSTFAENSYGESFKLNKNQRQLIETSNTLQVIQRNTQQLGYLDSCVLLYHQKTSCLKLILSAAELRDKAIQIITKTLGSITNNMEIERQELVFPLSDKQLKLATNHNNLKMLMNDTTHIGRIGVDKCLLKVSISLALPIISTVYKLEKRFGVLMTAQEIKQIKKNINIDNNSMNDHEENDKDFFNSMMIYVENGVKFIRHKKNGIYDERFVLIQNGRLYWKEKENEKNNRNRSIHLTNISEITIGKNTKALKHESLDYIKASCCFSIIAKKATLDLSTMDHIQVRKFTEYLKGLQTHFKNQKSQLIAQTPNKRHKKFKFPSNGNAINL